MKILQNMLLALLILPLSVSAGNVPSVRVGINIYTPILAIAVLGYSSSKFIRRNKNEGSSD